MPDHWHREVVDANVEQILGDLVGKSTLHNFYLAGGTGLALWLGHRRSVDLDFFSPEKWVESTLVQSIQHLPRFSVVATAPQTLHVQIAETKVSFLGYSYPVLFPFETFQGVKIADARDIACMKLSAIAARGARRDFVDLYVTARLYGLRPLLDWFQQKFAEANYSVVHVLKSLTYFVDAEKEPMPMMLEPITWEAVKNFFTTEAPALF